MTKGYSHYQQVRRRLLLGRLMLPAEREDEPVDLINVRLMSDADN